jgi:pimeloyl-ACP methyl ester carboxylesterase
MQNPKLVQIQTEDGLILPGLLYEAPKSEKVAVHLHGNGSTSVFYSDDQRGILAQALIEEGISFLLFNNRGAHYIKKLDIIARGKKTQKRFGTAYEKIKECVYDIDGAVDFLKNRGYREFYLIGESTGSNKICVYNFYKPNNRVAKYILLGGADDVGIYYDGLGKKRFSTLLKQSKEKIRKGEGEEVIHELLPDKIFSYKGFYDIANPDGNYNVFPFLEALGKANLSKRPLFRYYKSITKPTLVVYGEKDQYAWGDVPRVVEIMRKQKPEFTYKIIKDADHSFSEHQKQLAEVVCTWIKK